MSSARFWLSLSLSTLATAVLIISLLLFSPFHGPAFLGTVVVFLFALAGALLVRRKWPFALGIFFGTLLVIVYALRAVAFAGSVG